jgi:hypothetical protein
VLLGHAQLSTPGSDGGGLVHGGIVRVWEGTPKGNISLRTCPCQSPDTGLTPA